MIQQAYYQRIVRHIQHVMPQFGDFDLQLLADNNTMFALTGAKKAVIICLAHIKSLMVRYALWP